MEPTAVITSCISLFDPVAGGSIHPACPPWGDESGRTYAFMSSAALNLVPMHDGDLEGLSISAASLMLGVPAPTIRSWERRYGVGKATRTEGKHRRYDIKALAELRDLRDAIAAGRRANEAAELILSRTAARATNPAYIEGILAAGRTFDPVSIRYWLETATRELGLHRAIDLVVLPALREIGALWEAGKCDVANEHLASQEVRSWLAGQLKSARLDRNKPVILMVCGPKDLHTIGLEAFYVMLTRRGWSCRILGAMTPTSAAVAAAQGTGAVAAIVVSHMSTARREAVVSIRALEQLGLSIFYAGNAFVAPKARDGVPGTYLGDDLAAAALMIEQQLGG